MKSKVPGCKDCDILNLKCDECGRDIANEHDEGNHNTGACGCVECRSFCWKTWNEGKCRPLSPYDPDYEE